jgi:hypothetical protein
MCWALNHQNIIEMAQRHISLSPKFHYISDAIKDLHFDFISAMETRK